MSSLSSTETENFDGLFEDSYGLKPEEYELLSPTAVGNFFRGERPCHVVKFEGPPPKPMDRMEKESKRAYERSNSKYQAQNRTRMILDCKPEVVTRFTQNVSSLPYKVITRIDGTPFEAYLDRIHKGSKAQWSIQMYMNREKKRGKSYMIVRFESAADATVFKIFQI